MNKPKRKAWLIGLFAFLVIGGSIYFYIYLKGRNVFRPVNYYYAYFRHVDGLYKSNRILLNGLSIGHVADIQFKSDTSNYLIVKMQVDPKYKLLTTTRASIVNTGLIGGRVLQLTDAIGPGPYLHNGDTLSGAIDKSSPQIIEQNIGSMLTNIDELFEELLTFTKNANTLINPQNVDNISSIIAELNATMHKVNRAANRIDPLLRNADSTLSAAHTLFASTNTTAQKASAFIDTVNQLPLRNTIDQLQNATQKLNHTLNDLQNPQSTLGRLLYEDSIYQDARRTISALDSLVQDIQRNPKKYVKLSLF